MQRSHLIAVVAGLFLAGMGGYAACSMEVSDSADGLGATVPWTAGVASIDAGVSAPPIEGREPPQSPGEIAIRVHCGSQVCDDGEACCRTDGTCYPAGCRDCCPAMDEGPVPEVDLRPGIGDPAAPPPPPGTAPPPHSARPPIAVGPGPMPPAPGE